MNCLALTDNLNEEALHSLLSDALNRHRNSIYICSRADELVDARSHHTLKVVLQKLKGEFPTWIDIYGLECTSDLYIAKAISSVTASPVLISGEVSDPYIWNLWTGKQLVKVRLEDHDDESGGYKIEAILGPV